MIKILAVVFAIALMFGFTDSMISNIGLRPFVLILLILIFVNAVYIYFTIVEFIMRTDKETMRTRFKLPR